MYTLIFEDSRERFETVRIVSGFESIAEAEAKLDYYSEGFHTSYSVVLTESVPTDRTFRNSWINGGSAVQTDMLKAKLLAHDMRRSMRNEEMAPLDIEATIPVMAATAEAARQVLRDKYAVMQAEIDDAADEAGLKTSLGL